MSLKRLFISLFLVVGTLSSFAQEKKNFELEDLYERGTFRMSGVYGMNPLNDGNTYAAIDKGVLNVYDYKTGEQTKSLLNFMELIPEGGTEPIAAEGYELSADESKMLIPTETRSIYRHSSESNYYVYDLATKKLSPLSANGKQRLATFSPDGSKVAFMRDNNLFIKDLASGEEKQFTQDGLYNHIINGAPDWVYEEEFGFAQGFFWSPDGKKIAFYRFDESNVKEFQMEVFENLYPDWYSFKYPKAGESNSIVDVYVYHLEDGKVVKMDLGTETDIYIPRMKWTNDPETLAIQRLNRHQNHLEILLGNAENGSTKVFYDETNPYYIDITDDWTFMPDNKTVLLTSEKDGNNHIYLYGLDGKEIAQLTSGPWDVSKVYGYDAGKKEVYFQSAEISPIQRQIYAVNLKGKKRVVVDLKGTNDADFSSNFKYLINTHSSVDTPYEFALYQNNGKQVRMLKDNKKLLEKLQGYNLGVKEFFKISDSAFVMPDGSTVDVDAWRILPPDFDPNKKYPVLIYVYGGPGYQTVNDSWGDSDYYWLQLLAQHGIISVSINNRGSGAQGETFKKMTYMQLGKYETEDMITLAKYMAKQPYVDADKIGIYGWSYGGFVAANGITKGADVISTAVSVAPVTNWRYYDNVYTERYMRTPQENPEGYDENSPVNHTDMIKGNYLLCHGSGDDNVHYQNAMELIKAMIEQGKQFELAIYPNKNHGIFGSYEGGGNCRMHLFTKIDDFLFKHLLEE
jgi:Dipeptidyl aminopeptidases/acylaminoacyl-peptidases